MKTLFAVLGLVLIILASGCVGTTRPVIVSATDGLVINEFSSDITRYEDTEPVSLYLEIENIGGTTATNVDVSIIGAPWDADPNPSGSQNFELEPPDLLPVPPVPGEFKIFSWDLEPYIELPQGVELPVILTSRIEFDYSSNGVTQVPVINREEYKRRTTLGLEIPSLPNVTNSNGPVHIDVDQRGLPVVIESGETQEASLRLYIKNVGTGAPIKNYDIGNITIDLDLISTLDAEFTDCLGATSGTSASKEIVLRRGESVTVPCTINIESVPTLYDYISVVFSTNYRYYIEQPLTVTIVGTS